jgi:hypothetical protein
MVDGRWTLRDNTLTRIVSIDSGRTETQVLVVTIDESVMTQSMKNERKKLQRVGPRQNALDSIEGTWSYPHDAGGTAYEFYESDGRFLFRLPITTEPCSWAVDGDQLRSSMSALTSDSKWEITGDRLELNHDGDRQVFHRETTILPPAEKR